MFSTAATPRLLRLVLGFSMGWAGASASLEAQQFRALLFTKTAGWHHDSIPAGVEAIRDLSALHHFEVFWTEDANRVFSDAALARFDVVIFLLTSGEILNAEQKRAFERFIQSGKGFVGIHSASDTEYEWEWYTRMVGQMFHIHPAIQTATLQVEEPDFPGMDRFAPRFLFTDEWYEFGPPQSDQLHVLLKIDESTYRPTRRWGSNPDTTSPDRLQPIAWFQDYDGGRAFYTALGHLPATYRDPHFRHHLFGGIYWAATGKGFQSETE